MTTKVFISQRLGEIRPQNRPKIRANLLIYKYFANKSLFFKDLAENNAKYLIPKDRTRRGHNPKLCGEGFNSTSKLLPFPKPAWTLWQKLVVHDT